MRNRIKGKTASFLGGLVVLIAGAATLRMTWSDLLVWYGLRPHFTLLRWNNAQGYPEYRHRETGIIFVYLPGGTFLMGSSQNNSTGMSPRLNPALRVRLASTVAAAARAAPEYPRHEVSLRPFLIAKYEVSQSEWKRVMGSDRSYFDGDHFPVENVSWYDCQQFCEKTSLKLPTEAQWEHACRARTNTLYAFGDTVSTDQVNYDEDVFDEVEGPTVRVDAGPPNGFGLHNVHGNVWEWCQDAFRSDFYSQPEASDLDPVCTTTQNRSRNERRVVRGGSWAYNAWACRSAKRGWSIPTDRDSCTGFRPTFRIHGGGDR